MNNIEQLILFILVTAAEGDWDEKDLGPIHILKYVYLADLYHAQYNNGETYTKLAWRFHHFGPWELHAWKMIEPVAQKHGAVINSFSSSKFEDDFKRYCLRDTRLHDRLSQELPMCICGKLSSVIRKFGKGTADLLDMVYKTKPMLNAEPEAILDFSTAIIYSHQAETNSHASDMAEISKTAAKKKQAARAELKARLQKQLKIDMAKRETLKQASKIHDPKYDEEFVEISRHLDQLAGEPLTETEGVIEFEHSVWTSSLRKDSDEF